MSSTGASYAHLYMQQKKQKEKMKKMEEERVVKNGGENNNNNNNNVINGKSCSTNKVYPEYLNGERKD